MKHAARTNMSAAEVISALDSMPKERGSGFMSGRIVAWGTNRTYTRIDGDQFQVSRTAGMGSTVVASGKVVDEEGGGAAVFLTTTFGAWPLGTLLVVAVFLLVLAAYLVYLREYFNAVAAVIASGVSVFWYGMKFSGAWYLRSEISKHLDGIEWEPQQ